MKFYEGETLASSNMTTLFTSESVSAGHPDKVCDAISDAIVDACLRLDPMSRVAVETMVKGKSDKAVIILAGEVSLSGKLPPYEQIARETAANIGYTSHSIGMDATNPDLCEVQVHITTQSPNIAQGLNGISDDDVGAGDQGMMFGYACTETEAESELRGRFFPLPAALAQRICRRLDMIVQTNEIPWIRPDGKSQVTVEYDENNKPVKVKKVVIATQHDDMLDRFDSEKLEHAFIIENITNHVILPVLKEYEIAYDNNFLINGTGRFVEGGPIADVGLTGRKIIVDTYGGYARHGGGAFSGKDPSKVDRSAAYMTRYIAKNIVAAKLADRCEVQVAYCIGVAKPISVNVDTFNTGKFTNDKLIEIINEVFDLKPQSIISHLQLKKPIYRKLAAYGHLGKNADNYNWEKLDKVKELTKYL